MSVTGFLTTIGLYNHSVILAFGKPHWQTWLTLIYAVSNITIFVVAAPFGLIAIASGYVVRALALYPLSAGASMRILSLGIRPYILALMPASVGSAVMTGAVVGASVALPAMPSWLRLAALVLFGSAVYLVVVFAMARPAAMRICQAALRHVRRSSST
jgi:hypothetical protein